MTCMLATAAVPLIGQPLTLSPPVDVLFWFPYVFASAAKTEGLEAHRLECDVAGEDHQVGPGDLPSIFLFDRPEQAARLVEVHVVGPAIQWRETLRARAGATATVAGAIGARTVPRHANKERAVVAIVCRPPLLRIGHKGVEVFDDSMQIEALEFFRVVELFAHRIG